MSQKIVVRIPPSPTGNLHVGTARAALFNYLFAKKNSGKIILRSEDTDRARSKKEFEDNIIESLKWIGITYDEFYRQSERGELYRKYLEKMVGEGNAYQAEDNVIRFKNPNKSVKFLDIVRGEIEFDTTELEDFVIAKSMDEPLYHLAVVVDDLESSVTHVIRGEDHISNTPRQILIQEALGAPRPIYAHIPLVLAQDRSKLSKRHGAVSLLEFRDSGYLPQAMVNYLALLGWNPGTEQEIFTMEELIQAFSLEKIQKGGAIFDEKKLQWINRQHLSRLSPEEKLERAKSEFDITKEPELIVDKIRWKGGSKEETAHHLEYVRGILDSEVEIMAYAEKEGKGNVLWPLRYALSGLEVSPDPLTLIKILGVGESERRLVKAIEILK